METRLYLFGLPRLERGSAPLALTRRKALALAAYLALAARPRARDELAALLWPELGQERARAALRSTLPDLTTALPSGALVADRRSVGLHHKALWVDVLAFRALLAREHEHNHGDDTLCALCAAHHREAVTLHGEEFLHGFSLPDSPEFEAWQTVQRAALLEELAMALRRLALHTARQGQPHASEALGYAQRLLAIDPLHEPAHRLLMRLYADMGRPGEALRQYQRCVELLARELKTVPTAELTALAVELRAGRAGEGESGSGQAGLAPSLLPEPAGALSTFVGRERELAALSAQLAEPDCRLLTVTGPGGIGKTRLVIEAARMAAQKFAAGARFVALGDATDASHLLTAVAGALGVAPGGLDQSYEPLLAALREQQLLLVLDNFDQLVGEGELLLELLRAAPGLKLLISSRERLALRIERLLALEGLAFHLDDAVSAGGFSAVELFVQRARQVQFGFVLSAANSAAVVRICALVEGLPLGIELAAAWARSLTPAEIVLQIERGPDFLHAPLRDLPERHRSLRAVLSHTWELLAPAEQALFRHLGAFNGGFTAEAAAEVADATLYQLASLEDKSLLRRAAQGRYSFHLLLQQYAAERLAAEPTEKAARRARHARYYAGLAQRLGKALQGAGQPEALAVLAEEAANLRAAWAWVLSERDLEAIGLMLDCLARYNDLRGSRQEGAAALAGAEAALGADDLPHEAAAAGLLGRVLAWRARLLLLLNRDEEAEKLLARAVVLAEGQADLATLGFCLASRGLLANMRGEQARAVRQLTRALAAYAGSDDHSAIGDALNRLGGAFYDMGDLAEARRRWRESYASFERAGDLSGMARDLSNLGEVARVMGAFDEARLLAERSLAMLGQLGRGWQSQYPLLNLGLLELFAGRPAEAVVSIERARELSRRIGDQRGLATAALRLADVALSEGQLEQARVGYLEGATLFKAIRRPGGVGLCLNGLADVASAEGEHSEAVGFAQESLEIARSAEAVLAAGEALGALGQALGVAGNLAAAEAALREALRIFEQAGARPDALEARARLAALLLHTPSSATPSGRARIAALIVSILNDPAARAQTRARAAQLAAAAR